MYLWLLRKAHTYQMFTHTLCARQAEEVSGEKSFSSQPLLTRTSDNFSGSNRNLQPQCKCEFCCCCWRISHTLVPKEGSLPEHWGGFSPKWSVVWEWYDHSQFWRYWAHFAFQLMERAHSIKRPQASHSDYKWGFCCLGCVEQDSPTSPFPLPANLWQLNWAQNSHVSLYFSRRLNGTGRIKEEKQLFTPISGSRKNLINGWALHPLKLPSCMTAGEWFSVSSHFLLDQLSQTILSPSWQL